MKDKLVVYCKGNRKDIESVYGDNSNTCFFNASRRPMSDLQGMRFSIVIIEEDVSESKAEFINKHYKL